MPTGSGKTGILMLAAFQQRAGRVLVIAPSRILRKQLREGFTSLRTLRECGALAAGRPLPAVGIVTERPKEVSDWESLRMFDVVVTTPQCLSPSYSGVATPPPDLFDLILVDEAHHSPAPSWRELIFHFEGARRIFFTATPFRRDLKQIPGRVIYSFPLREAYKDKIFGKIHYERVEETDAGADVDVARAAERVLKRDREEGFRHLLMVRTDLKKRALELKDVYDKNTGLRLDVVHGSLPERTIDETLRKLEAHSIDGVICVDMLGEGFDFPHLKVAAIHAPHKSLAVTLQFIGRLARTNAPDIGSASFLATEHDIDGEMQRMYREGAVWQEMVIDMSESRIAQEIENREVNEGFEAPSIPRDAEIDVPLDVLRPFNHLKVYEIDGAVNMTIDTLDLGTDSPIVFDRVHTELNTRVFVTCHADHPKWCISDAFDRPEYNLFVAYYHAASRLLFINATDKTTERYEDIASLFIDGSFRILPTQQMNKVLLDLEETDFFNIGMRNVHQDDNTESYRTLTGSRVQHAIRESDGMLYHRGHVFGSARDGDNEGTIGFSSSSKVWRNGRTPIPILLKWCDKIATKLVSNREVTTGSNLDHLRVGELVTRIPEGIVAVHWSGREYRKQTDIRCTMRDGECLVGSVLDLDMIVDRPRFTPDCVAFRVIWEGKEWTFTFSLQEQRMFAVGESTSGLPTLEIELGRTFSPLVDYFNSHPLSFFTADCSRLSGRELFRFQSLDQTLFPQERMIPVDWANSNVCIQTEFGAAEGGKISIHDFLKTYLDIDQNDVVLYDHRSGEVADFICIAFHGETIRFTLYHCKGSGEAFPGERVEDIYEVIGQVIKSHGWLNDNRRLHKRLQSRIRSGSTFVRGNKDLMNALFDATRTRPCVYEVAAVQPGICRARMTGKVARIFGAASDFLVTGRCEPLKLLCSV